MEYSIQWEKQTPNRVVSLVSLCSVVGRRRGKGMSIGYKGVELRETIQWFFEALKLLRESEKLEKNFLRVKTAG